MHLCLVGIVSLSHCLPVMRQRFMFAFNHSVVVFFFLYFLIIHLSKTAVDNENNVYLSNATKPFLKCESHEVPEGVSGVFDDTDTVCPFDNHA